MAKRTSSFITTSPGIDGSLNSSTAAPSFRIHVEIPYKIVIPYKIAADQAGQYRKFACGVVCISTNDCNRNTL